MFPYLKKKERNKETLCCYHLAPQKVKNFKQSCIACGWKYVFEQDRDVKCIPCICIWTLHLAARSGKKTFCALKGWSRGASLVQRGCCKKKKKKIALRADLFIFLMSELLFPLGSRALGKRKDSWYHFCVACCAECWQEWGSIICSRAVGICHPCDVNSVKGHSFQRHKVLFPRSFHGAPCECFFLPSAH